ncbi:MAG: hypothetical protein KF868_06475 [Acidobacteria bacterium]|nr:hypothetical protein [Acidobacteriota bacterium]MCW5969732.1 hypothetical protein [Blastocatellales bacterium]
MTDYFNDAEAMTMQLTRKEFLGLLAMSPAALVARDDGATRRAAQLLSEYDGQGIHRTGTRGDGRSARWLAAQAGRYGGAAALESFALNRVDPQACFVAAGGRRVTGLPVFDALFTGAPGIRGSLGPFGSEADIGWIEMPPNAEYDERYEPMRRDNRHRAIIILTKGERPGLCPVNAPRFEHPYGAPVLQIGSEHGEWLQKQTDVHFVAQAKRTGTRAFNVTARIRGTKPNLPPVVVMTPRSGWWHSTSERGGGLVCWLEVMRALAADRPERDVHFLSSSGHELGHLGLKHFMDRNPDLVSGAHVWMHFGANIGAVGAPNRIQAASDELEALVVSAVSGAGLTINEKTNRGVAPFGEAGNIHRAGGRYLSLLCLSNPLFHHPEDRWPGAADAQVVARYSAALVEAAKKLTRE